jgi:hypothetical protein
MPKNKEDKDKNLLLFMPRVNPSLLGFGERDG